MNTSSQENTLQGAGSFSEVSFEGELFSEKASVNPKTAQATDQHLRYNKSTFHKGRTPDIEHRDTQPEQMLADLVLKQRNMSSAKDLGSETSKPKLQKRNALSIVESNLLARVQSFSPQKAIELEAASRRAKKARYLEKLKLLDKDNRTFGIKMEREYQKQRSLVDKIISCHKPMKQKEEDLSRLLKSIDPDNLAAEVDFDQLVFRLKEYFSNKKDYLYESGSDNSQKYEAPKNFKKWKTKKKRAYLLALWKKCFTGAVACAVTINQLAAINLKITYFGQHMLSQERKQFQSQQQHIKRFILEPTSNFKVLWSSLILVMVVYTATVSPVRLAFYNDSLFDLADLSGWAPFYSILDILIDVIFSVDIFINFISAYERMDGTLEYSLKKIAFNYLTGFFLVDLIATIPFPIIFELMGKSEDQDSLHAATHALAPQQNPASILRIARMQRLSRLLRMVRLMKMVNIGKYSEHIKNWLFRLKIEGSVARLFKAFSISLLCVHLFSCFFYIAAKVHDFDQSTWVARRDLFNEPISQLYLESLYWAFQTLSTVGYGDFGAECHSEIFITLVWMFLGVAFYTVCVGSFTSIMVEQYAKQEMLDLKIKALKVFAKESNLDKVLEKQITVFLFNNYLELAQNMDENKFIDSLPATLKEEVLIHAYGKSILYKYDFFSRIGNNDLQWGMLKKITRIRYENGDTIYHDNSTAPSMFLIAQGTVKLFAENDCAFAVYRMCASFGDVDVFCNQKRNGTARSLDYSQFYVISKTDIEDLMEDFPNIRRELAKEALQKNLQLLNKRKEVMKQFPLVNMMHKTEKALLRIKTLRSNLIEYRKTLLGGMAAPELKRKSIITDLLEQPKVYRRKSLSDFDLACIKHLQTIPKLPCATSRSSEKRRSSSWNGLGSACHEQEESDMPESEVKEHTLKMIQSLQEVNRLQLFLGSVQSEAAMAEQPPSRHLEMLVNYNKEADQMKASAEGLKTLVELAAEENLVVMEWLQHLEKVSAAVGKCVR